MKRRAIGILALCAFVVIVSGVALLHLRNFQDGTPDGRLLAGMQQVVWDTQAVLDETGEVPQSLDEVVRMSHPEQTRIPDHFVLYERVKATTIRLCGVFSSPSTGQSEAWPLFDVRFVLQRELTGPHPWGRHCYDITLQGTDPSTREDALLLREINAAGTAVECAFSENAVLPRTIPNLTVESERQRYNPACIAHRFIKHPNQAPEYTPEGATSIRLCGNFKQAYSPSDTPAPVFDPVRDARFAELLQPRTQAGRNCFLISMLIPDPKADMPAPAWEEPIKIGQLPTAMRDGAEHDKKAVGDFVDVLRLARCAFTMGGTAAATFKDAVQTVASHPGMAQRYNCNWAPDFYSAPENFPIASYERMDNSHIRVCTQFRLKWDRPLALNYYKEALTEWPTSLPELQRPLSQPGQACYSVRLTAIGSGAI